MHSSGCHAEREKARLAPKPDPLAGPVFVDTHHGDDANDGTESHPVRTLRRGAVLAGWL